VCPLLEGGGPRARRRFSGVGFPCPRLGSGEARSCPLNGPILGLIAPIRPLQLCADGGYQLRFRGLEGTPNYGPRQVYHDLYTSTDKIFGYDIVYKLLKLVLVLFVATVKRIFSLTNFVKKQDETKYMLV
jgi:hypothetical protein